MVLDTCALLWLAFNREKFTRTTLDLIDASETLYISTMSFWEIGIKLQKKKLTIPMELTEFVRLYSGNAAVTVVAPDLDIVFLTLGLQWAHSDPVDRMVVATAMKYDTRIVTGDAEIVRFYPRSIL
jgi:PIN domain nuclease of toxin-antitoxin system